MKRIDNLWNILDDYEMPEKLISEALRKQQNRYGEDIKDILSRVLQDCWDKKVNKKDVNVIEVIDYINTSNLPVYSIEGKMLIKKSK